ncbi:MAG: hypothetical protein F6J87_09575 [Spirulina sp. SIO3F2]|nr:hypothetical protein [Spirulina sp. SIO3F2]
MTPDKTPPGKITRGKILAVITGIISVTLALLYLALVQILDWRGEMLPAPTDLSLLGQALGWG